MSALEVIFLLFMLQTSSPSGSNKLPDCRISFYGSTGQISPLNRSCTWTIFAPPENLILLEFQNFEFGGGNVTQTKPSECKNDKLEIFAINSRNIMKRQAIFCGSIPQPVIYKTSTIKITFTSHHDTVESRFLIKYSIDKCDKFQGNCHHKCKTTVQKTRNCVCSDGFTLTINGLDCFRECHYEIASSHGFIHSLNYPDVYPPHRTCTWRITTTPGHQIQLNFLVFVTERCKDCTCDYLAIYDGSFADSNHLKTLCETKSGTKITFSTNELFIVFKSDGSNVYEGFEAKYSSVCGGAWKVKTQEHYIYSHEGFTVSDYSNDVVCDWTIIGMDGFATKLNIEFLDIEESENCETDFVEILDSDLVKGKYCGSEKPMAEFISYGNFTVRFRSDDSVTGRGFRIKYQAMKNLTVPKVRIE